MDDLSQTFRGLRKLSDFAWERLLALSVAAHGYVMLENRDVRSWLVSSRQGAPLFELIHEFGFRADGAIWGRLIAARRPPSPNTAAFDVELALWTREKTPTAPSALERIRACGALRPWPTSDLFRQRVPASLVAAALDAPVERAVELLIASDEPDARESLLLDAVADSSFAFEHRYGSGTDGNGDSFEAWMERSGLLRGLDDAGGSWPEAIKAAL